MKNIVKRNNVQVLGTGNTVIVFAHGFGCDQTAWKYLLPYLKGDYTFVLFDYVGAGKSDLGQYDQVRYNTLRGYAEDLLEICDTLNLENVIFAGHSVSCMIGALASIRRPGLFSKMIFIGPSPCYINKEGYTGGFDQATIDELMEVMEEDYISWARSLAPEIMDRTNDPALGNQLADSFCYIDPVIAKQFARVTFLSDNRSDLSKIAVPSLTILCRVDMISPLVVGEFIRQHTPGNEMIVMEGRGHCPHMSQPAQTAQVMQSFIDGQD